MSGEEDMPHPYTSFNKQPQEVPTLIGNWQEERALKEVTGVTRYEPWTEPGVRDRTEDLRDSVFTRRQDAAPEAQTFTRTIEHTQQTHPGNWTTLTQVSYQDPKTKPTLMGYKDIAEGPRERKLREAMMAEAKRLPDAIDYALTERQLDPNRTGRGVPPPFTNHNMPAQLDTTYRGDYDLKDGSDILIGARVMKDRDGRPAVRDPTFLAETQLIARANVDRIMLKAGTDAGATQTVLLSDSNVPITIYSEAVAKGTYGGNLSGTRTMSHVAPFNKFSNFSKPMSEYSKVVIDE